MRSGHVGGAAVVLGLIGSAGLAGTARAQFVEPGASALHTFPGPGPGALMGWAVSGLTDIDGDGATDLILPAPGFTISGVAGSGRVEVRSGRTGGLLWTLDSPVLGAFFGHAIADAGDVDADGTHDIAVGAINVPGDAGRVYVYSGATGGLLLDLGGPVGTHGFSLAGPGDLNADGHDDVVVGASTYDGPAGADAGAAFVYSGADGSVLRTHHGAAAGARLGRGAGVVGDVNADGIDDYVVTADRAGAAPRGRGYVFSGADGSLLLPELRPESSAGTFGEFFAGPAGDVNADGVPDVYVGDYAVNRAYVYDGATGLRLLRWQSVPGLGCGRGAGDVDFDGHDDLAIGAYLSGTGGSGAVRLYSGRTGMLIRTVTASVAGANLGFDAVGVGDLDGDGGIEILAGAAGASGNIAYVIRGTPPPCGADANADTTLDAFDFNAFADAFNAGNLSVADANADTTLDAFDFNAFVDLFNAGCP